MKQLPKTTYNERQEMAGEMEEILRQIHDALTDKPKLSKWEFSVKESIEQLFCKATGSTFEKIKN